MRAAVDAVVFPVEVNVRAWEVDFKTRKCLLANLQRSGALVSNYSLARRLPEIAESVKVGTYSPYVRICSSGAL